MYVVILMYRLRSCQYVLAGEQQDPHTTTGNAPSPTAAERAAPLPSCSHTTAVPAAFLPGKILTE